MATAFSDDQRFLSLTTPLGKDVLLVRRFSAAERLSRLFSFDLSLMADLSKASQVSAANLLGKQVLIRVGNQSDSPRYFHGVVSRFTESDQDLQFRYYQMQVVPWFWLLTLRTNCRIFQQKTVPDIIAAVFKADGFNEGKDFKNILSRTYTSWDFCVQYRETDYNFVCRLMEEEGIFYYFEYSQQGHTLVLADALGNAKASPGQSEARFAPAIGFGQDESVVTSWLKTQSLAPGKYMVRDYHFAVPQKTLQAEVPTAFTIGGNTDWQIYDFPGEYAQKFNDTDRLTQKPSPLENEAELVAKLRMEEEETPHEIYTGSSDCRHFELGYTFQLNGHPTMSGQYAFLALQHTVDQSPVHASNRPVVAPYTNSLECIPSGRTFRPPRVTLRPLVQGPQTAFVVDETSDPDADPTEEIWPDKYGRVRVRFRWDRDGKYSCWLRVAQPWAGKRWGFQWIPRVGDEVVVDFIEGDPDLPIVIGSAYNYTNMPIYKLPDNKTQSGIKTNSSPKGTLDNYNELRFEDKKGQEDLLIHAERTMHNSVEASQFITVGGDRNITTGGIDKYGNKFGDVKELVYRYHNLHVRTDQRIKIEGERHLHVQQDADATYDQDLVTSVGQKCVILADTIQLQGTQKIVLMAGASSIVIDASGVTILGTPLINLNTPGAPPIPEISPLVVDPDDPS